MLIMKILTSESFSRTNQKTLSQKNKNEVKMRDKWQHREQLRRFKRAGKFEVTRVYQPENLEISTSFKLKTVNFIG